MRKLFAGVIPVLTLFCVILILLPVYFENVSAQTTTPSSTKTPTPPPQKSSVGGTIFNDLNSNQVQNTFPLYESGITGWKVFIYDTSWNKLATTVTASQGRYSIRGLGAGTYYVCEEIQSGWSQTAPGVGAPNTIVAVPSEASGSNCGIITVSGAVQDIRTVNFGDIHQIQQPTPTPLPTTPISPTRTLTPTGALLQAPTVVSVCSPNGGNHWIVTNPNNVQLTLSYYFYNVSAKTQSYIKFLNPNSSTELFVSSEYTHLSLTAIVGFTQFQQNVPYDSLVCGTPTPTLTLTSSPTTTPTEVPTETPTDEPTPTTEPTQEPTATETPTDTPTDTPVPTDEPTPTDTPYETPTEFPTETPTEEPSYTPTEEPSPTEYPTETPTDTPYETPTEYPTEVPTDTPYETPTEFPTEYPTETPTEYPTEAPTDTPYETPTEEPSPTEYITETPYETPTEEPSYTPTEEPSPTEYPTETPTDTPYETPTDEPTPTEYIIETPTDEPTPTEEFTPTQEPAATEEPSPTEIPTQTPTETPEPTPTPTSAFTGNSQISGNLFIDETNDGEYNPELGEEILQESILVSLYDSFWNLIQTQDIQNGGFSFNSLGAGEYQVCAQASTGWTQTAPYLSNPNYTSVMAPPPISKPCYVISVDGSSSSTGHMFGFF